MTLPVFCARALSACGVALGLVGCNIDQILKVDDPDIVIQANSPAPASNIGLMFALIGYSENLAGELFCNGTPLSYLSGSTAVYGDPLTNDSVFALAIAAADSALANRAGVDSARVRQLASVVKGRALLNRGQFANAALAVALVADTFHFDVTHSLVTLDNLVWSLNNDARRYTMADREGGNGLPFFSANDPRIPRKLGTVNPDDLTFDSGIFVTRQGIWDRSTALKIATGIEARLIEAEAALHASPPDNATWFAKLSALRANTALLPTPQSGYTAGTYKPFADPNNDPARADSTFRERAFWMFSTGHRLGDLRRLVRQYLRAPETVYPTGAWYKGGNYGDATMLPVPFDEQNNPKYTQCLDRNP